MCVLTLQQGSTACRVQSPVSVHLRKKIGVPRCVHKCVCMCCVCVMYRIAPTIEDLTNDSTLVGMLQVSVCVFVCDT